MRFAWNSAVAAVGLMAGDQSVKGPITGDGYTIKRNPKKKGKQQFVIILTEGEYGEEEGEQNGE